MIPYKRCDDVVAYMYQADLYCSWCIAAMFDTFPTLGADAERVLDVRAGFAHVDREDEASFDSDDFPKVVFRDDLRGGDTCGECGEILD